jgi:hypothetical protein
MKTIRKLCFFMLTGLLLHFFTGCSAEKDIKERRNLMMPKKSELPRNKLYQESAKKKTFKSHAKKKGRHKKLF